MKKNKVKMEKYENDDVKLVKKLIVILVVVILVAIGFYFLTDKVVMKDNNTEETKVEINYDNATMGTILNRPYDEYFVLIYNSEESEAAYYGTLLNNYSGDNKVYFVDLALKSSENYISEKSSGIFKDIKDAKFSGPTLLEIKDGKVKSFLESKEDIKELLK